MAIKSEASQALYLDRSIAIYVFLPITFIMLLVGLGQFAEYRPWGLADPTWRVQSGIT
jgi:hypothetical protein